VTALTKMSGASSADSEALLPRVAEREATIGGRACFCAALAFADRLVLVASQRATFGALVAAQASSLPGGPRGAFDVRTLLGRPRRGGEEDVDEGGGNLQTLVARRLVERLARAADADGGASAADRPLLLGIALGPGAEESLAAAREVADVLAELLAEVGVAVAPERSAAAAADDDVAPAAGRSSSLLVAMPEALRAQVRAAMPLHRDFPRAGIVFVDVLPLWRAPALLAPTLAALADAISARFGPRLDFVAGLEARGFLFQSVALALKLPFVCVRKAGKLPGETVSLSYSLEYGEATLEVSRDAVARGARGIVLDDLLATGGSAAAAATLLASLGAVVVGAAFLVDINIGGAERIGLPVLAVVRT
jgi:adenine phosphoribosyltransferase